MQCNPVCISSTIGRKCRLHLPLHGPKAQCCDPPSTCNRRRSLRPMTRSRVLRYGVLPPIMINRSRASSRFVRSARVPLRQSRGGSTGGSRKRRSPSGCGMIVNKRGPFAFVDRATAPRPMLHRMRFGYNPCAIDTNQSEAMGHAAGSFAPSPRPGSLRYPLPIRTAPS